MSSENFPSPVFEEINIFGLSSEEWDIPMQKIKRGIAVAEKVATQGVKRLGELSEEGQVFLMDLLTRLGRLCFEDSNNITENIDINLISTLDGETFDYVPETGEPKTPISDHPHNQQTLRAAQILLELLTPEMSLNVQDDMSVAGAKAKSMEGIKRSNVFGSPSPLMCQFATVIPGVLITYTRNPFAENSRFVSIRTNLDID